MISPDVNDVQVVDDPAEQARIIAKQQQDEQEAFAQLESAEDEIDA